MTVRCWFRLDDGREVVAEYTDDAPELSGMVHIRVMREDLPEDMRATWERGSPGFVGIVGYFGKCRVRAEEPD